MASEMPLTGRDPELGVLTDGVARAARGDSAVVVVVGEAGVGKTRLLREAGRLARAAGLSRVVTRSSPGEEEIPLAAMRRELGALPASSEARGRLASLLTTSSGRDVRYQLVESAIDATMDLVEARAPLALVMEDVQWADPQTLQAVRAVARRSAGRGVLLVLAARPLPRPPGLTRLLQADELDVRVLDLQPLGDVAVEQLVDRVTGGRPGPALRRQLARTGGNPLLVEQLLAEVARTDALRVTAGVADLWPGASVTAPDLALHVATRMDALPDPARQVVTLVALSDLTAVQLARLLDTTVAAIAGSVEAAVSDGLVVAGGTRLRLRHDLLRDAVLARLPDAVLAGLHADLSRLLTDEGADLSRIVPHLVGSGPGGPGQDAAVVAEAGRQLLSSAPAVAASLLRRARDAGAPDTATDLAMALILLGDVTGARALVGERGTEAPPPHPRARLAMAQLDFLRGRLRDASRAFECVADELDDAGEGRVALADAAICSLLIGQLDRADQLAARTVEDGDDPHGDAAAGAAMLVQGWVAALRGDLATAVERSTAGHDLAVHGGGSLADAAQPDFFLGQVLLWADRPHDADSVIRRGLSRAEELGMSWASPPLHAVRAEAHLRAGRWDQADADLRAALSLAEDVEVEHGLPWCLAAAARLAIGRGEDAGPLLVRAEGAVGRLGGQGADVVLWTRGLDHLRRGRHAEAAQVLGLLWARLGAAGTPLRQVHIAPDLVRAAVVADPERAIAVEQELEQLAARAPWRRAEAVWTHARGMLAGEPVVLAQAASVLAGLDDPVEGARMRVDAAAFADGHAAARSHRDAARRVLDPAGAVGWLDDAGLHRAAAAPLTGMGGLTPAQARIVELVGEGLSNAQIADRLTVSRRTVESHLYHTYARLGISSRMQLGLAAARASREGWQAPTR